MGGTRANLAASGARACPRRELQRGRWDTGAASQPRGWCGRCRQEGQRGKGRAKRFGETRRGAGSTGRAAHGVCGRGGPASLLPKFLAAAQLLALPVGVTPRLAARPAASSGRRRRKTQDGPATAGTGQPRGAGAACSRAGSTGHREGALLRGARRPASDTGLRG